MVILTHLQNSAGKSKRGSHDSRALQQKLQCISMLLAAQTFLHLNNDGGNKKACILPLQMYLPPTSSPLSAQCRKMSCVDSRSTVLVGKIGQFRARFPSIAVVEHGGI